MKKFIQGRLRSIHYAIKGFFLLLRTEDAIIFHSIIFVTFVALGFYTEITPTQWMFQTIAFSILFVTEALNTAIEKLCDFVHPQYHEKIGEVKDVSAGAVTFASFFGMAVLGMIYLPYLWDFFFLR